MQIRKNSVITTFVDREFVVHISDVLVLVVLTNIVLYFVDQKNFFNVSASPTLLRVWNAESLNNVSEIDLF